MASGEIPEQQIAAGHLNDIPFEVYGTPLELPTHETQREICVGHIQEGRASEMMGDFWMVGCHFPEADTNNTAVHLALSCRGISRFRKQKQCRLTLTQVDDNGKELTKGTWEDN